MGKNDPSGHLNDKVLQSEVSKSQPMSDNATSRHAPDFRKALAFADDDTGILVWPLPLGIGAIDALAFLRSRRQSTKSKRPPQGEEMR